MNQPNVKMLEVRIIVPQDMSDEALNAIGDEMQMELPAMFENEGIEVHNVTYEVKPVPKEQAV